MQVLAFELVTAMAPPLSQTSEVAIGKAFVVVVGTLLRVDRFGMAAAAHRIWRPSGSGHSWRGRACVPAYLPAVS